ncbi:protein SWEETIE isoform X2 [Aristolochia californica]|uniref:protein SWEETIE isoform X2 n=1 Tax=Aristolochia californica TaxID=171875 RepID=UPI0035DCDF43
MAKRVDREVIPLSRLSVLVAQLESIVASSAQQPPDPLLCFDLLSNLVAVIEDEPKDTILYCQRKCEDALHSLLILGARRPVRRLASVAMCRIIAKGDGISIYSRASSLQGFLSDGRRGEAIAYAGAAQCLGELYRFFGRRITSGLPETTNIAAKLMKFHEDFVRQEALQMLQNALEGSDGSGALTAYSEALRIIMRLGVADKSFFVRLAAARCLKTVANIGGPGLGVGEFENCAVHCVKALEDPIQSVRDAFAEALGALLALGMNPDAQVQPKGKGHPVLLKKIEGSLQKHLILPFLKASGLRLKDLRIGLSLSWVFFLQAMHLKYRLPDGELQSFGFQAMDMLEGNSADAHSLACVLYILRIGVVDQMTEPTQRSFLVLLGRQLEFPEISPYKAVSALRTLSYLLTTIGEVPGDFKEILDNTVIGALSCSSLLVRIEAALALRALAEVDPTCVGGLISYGVTTLHALREVAAGEKGERLKVELDSLHGQALVLAALVSISPKLLLGYPAQLPKSVFNVLKKMLTEFRPNSAMVEKEAGWLLLASLIASMPKEELEDQVFDIMSLWAAPFGGNPELQIKQVEDPASELRVWSAAVEALTAFIRSFVSPTTVASNGGIFLQPVLYYLSRALYYISSLAAKQVHNLKPQIDQFIIRTLVAYQSISEPMAYKNEHPQILNICTTPFRDPSACEESSCLMMLLDKRDACLGPLTPGRDWFEDELRAFEGGKDGLMPCVWDTELSSFPQAETISKILVNQKLRCFGTIFATQNDGGKLRLLSMIEQSLKAGKKQSWHTGNMTNVCVGLLAGLKALLAFRTHSLGADVLSSSQAIFQVILADGDVSAAQRRASAEGLGLIARLGNDMFTPKMTRSLLGDLVGLSDPGYIGSIALSLGCIHRSAGGMALSTMVPATVSAISSLAKSPNASLQTWSLHGLLLTIEAAGLSYVSHVQATLLLVMDIVLSEENGWVDLRQGVGRLVNAIVAVLGPELSPGSTFFSRCKSLVAEISSGQETSTLLECVRFTQQLVLFAPHAVSVHSHVKTLLPTLCSRQPALRHLTVSTLRHLIEKDPIAIIDEQIEVHLFQMLDEETDSEIGNLVRSTIKRLLYASCPSCPSRWIALCQNMVSATWTMKAAEIHRGAAHSTLESATRTYYGEDDEDMIAGSSEGSTKNHTDASNFYLKQEKHLRFRTRVFAAECLSYLPAAVGTDPVHFDLSLARESLPSSDPAIRGDWLILHLQELVALAYQVSTSQFENMQPIGVGLLITIMDKFEKVPDPELPGRLLMEQYQAQLVSAVRTALNSSSSPLLLEAGLLLATKVLTSTITRGDRVALHRLFMLISQQLSDFKDLCYPSFAEWVACRIKVRLVAAHASVKLYTYMFFKEQQEELRDEYISLVPLFSKTSSILGNYWIQILKDYCYICFRIQSKSNHNLFLDGLESPLVLSKVKPCLDELWPVILQAVTLDAVPGNFEIDGSLGSCADDLSQRIFISGCSMVQLELKEFYFLWGYLMLSLFQLSVLGKHVIRLAKSRCDGASMVGEPKGLGLEMYEAPFKALQSLCQERFFGEFLSVDLCQELLQVILYLDSMISARNNCHVALLSQIVQACPLNFFELEDFTFLAMELCLTYLYRTFQSNKKSQEDENFKNVISTLFVTAEIIINRLNRKKQGQLILALLSTSFECLKCAYTESCLSSVTAFLHSITVRLRQPFEDEDARDKLKVLSAWQAEILYLCHECTKSIHMVEGSRNNSKLLLLKLSFCMEQAISIVRLAYENQQCRRDEQDNSSFYFTLCRNATRCFQIALGDSNIQVQAVALYVLKSIVQKELREVSRKEMHLFVLFLAGELLGDIFVLIQNLLKKTITKESIAIINECLRLLVYLQTLSLSTEYVRGIITLLLEAITVVVSAATEGHSQVFVELKTNAIRVVSHLAQIPSSAVQFKEVLLAMPTAQRQHLQEILRPSVNHNQNAIPNVSPITKFSVQLEQSPPLSEPMMVNAKEESEEEDDWDTFQSSSAAEPSINMLDGRIEAESSSIGNSSILGNGSEAQKDFQFSENKYPNDEERFFDSDKDDSQNNLENEMKEKTAEVSLPQFVEGVGDLEENRSQGENDFQEFSENPHLGNEQSNSPSKELSVLPDVSEMRRDGNRTGSTELFNSQPSEDDILGQTEKGNAERKASEDDEKTVDAAKGRNDEHNHDQNHEEAIAMKNDECFREISDIKSQEDLQEGKNSFHIEEMDEESVESKDAKSCRETISETL